MDAVMKIGGSLAQEPKRLIELCNALNEISESFRFLVIPGGGAFADLVRDFDRKINLSNTTAHRMAILAMEQYGLLLLDKISNAIAIDTLDEIRIPSEKKGLFILLPSKMLLERDQLEHSWNITSDSITAYIATILGVNKIILIKDVDGIFTDDPKKNSNAKFLKKVSAKYLENSGKKSSVDSNLPRIIINSDLSCYVVNGKHPERVKALLRNEETIFTKIVT